LSCLPASTITEVEEPSPYAVPDFYYDIDFVLNLVFAFALPPMDSEEELNSVFAVLLPQYQAWLNSRLLPFNAPPPPVVENSVNGNEGFVEENVIVDPVVVLPPTLPGLGGNGGSTQDLTPVPEPGTAWLVFGAAAWGWARLRAR